MALEGHKRRAEESEEDDNHNHEGQKRVRWTNEEDPTSPTPTQRSSSDATPDPKPDEVFSTSGRVGGAYYNPSTAKLYFLEDTTDGVQFDLVKMFLEQTKPDTCLVSSRADEPLIQFCQQYMELFGGQCVVRPHREFVTYKGQEKLQQIRILAELPQSDLGTFNDSTSPTAPRNVNEFVDSRSGGAGDPTTQRTLAAIRRLNFGGNHAPLCMAATAALLDQLLRVHAASELDESQNHMGALNIDSIEVLALDEYMQINADALSSLQIFDDENHASVHSDKTKEGHSLFQLINHTSTHLGRGLLRRWCLRPSLSIPTIEARHAAIECFNLPDNVAIANALSSNLRALCGVPKAMALLRTGRGRLSEWRAIANFSYRVGTLKDAIGELIGREGVGVIEQFLVALDGVSSEDTGILINTIIDWEESQNTKTICVNPGIDDSLDEKKRTYNGLDDLLVRVARDISQSVPEEFATELQVLYFPQIGFVIRIPRQPEWTRKEDFEQVPGWWKTDENVFYKSPKMKDLDIYVGDLHSHIADREIEIIEETLARVLQQDKAIVAVCEAAAEVDCLLSLAFSSRINDWVKPEMTEDNVLEIQSGHHPLQALQVPTFVPNDIHIVGGRGIGVEPEESEHEAKSVMIVTGANACGKSVYLKQNALIPFMAQIGCFVPAKSARLGVVDKIFTRVQTQEGVSKLQSSFMIDLSQVSLALRNSTARSLIVLDEFGKGSLSTDGAGLFAGVVSHLLKREAECPKVLASTHFHELFTRGLIPPSFPISYAYMNILLTQSSGAAEADANPQTEITYLYKVTPGLCLESYAAECARSYGLRSDIVERARFVSDVLKRDEIGLLLDEDMTEEEEKELEECVEVCQKFARWKMSAHDEVNVKDRLRAVLGR
ncbi:MutS protein msh5 [Ceratobasidium sp. 392]|nr:MutS protein msh5 [Ceratobasidium sp. 392]